MSLTKLSSHIVEREEKSTLRAFKSAFTIKDVDLRPQLQLSGDGGRVQRPFAKDHLLQLEH